MQLVKTAKSVQQHDLNLYFSKGQENVSKSILLIGGCHGDEPQGVELLNAWLSDFTLFQHKNSFYILPCLNPDGYAVGTRTNANEVDLNRNFPTTNWALGVEGSEFFGGEFPKSEPETCFMVDILDEYKFDAILTIHAPFGVINFDGAAKELAQSLSEIYPMPLQKDIGYPTPGSFGTYCGVERSIPTVTLELLDEKDISLYKTEMFQIFEFLADKY